MTKKIKEVIQDLQMLILTDEGLEGKLEPIIKKLANLIGERKMKEWWKSKIIWLNIIAGVLELGQVLLELKIVPPTTILLVTNVLNIILRKFFTETPIGKPEQPSI